MINANIREAHALARRAQLPGSTVTLDVGFRNLSEFPFRPLVIDFFHGFTAELQIEWILIVVGPRLKRFRFGRMVSDGDIELFCFSGGRLERPFIGFSDAPRVPSLTGHF